MPGISVNELFYDGLSKSDPDFVSTIIRTYFDESTDGASAQFMAVGGLIGGPEQWSDFEMKWAAATYDLKEPFHSTDCESQHGQFKDWPKEKCDALFAKLVGILDGCMIVAFGSIIPIQEYRSTFPDNGEHDPYFLALAHTLINMAHIGAEISPSLASGVSVCCEEDRRTSARAYQLYADLKATSSWSDGNKLVDFSVASKSLNGLQGADVLAREAFKHASNLGKRRTRKPVKRLRNRTSFHLWTKECLEYLKSRGGLDNLEALTSWDDGSAALPQFTTFYRDSFGE